MSKIIDLSQTITDNMPVYPGDDSPRLQKVNNLISDGFNNYQLSTSMHTATHIDGPMHLTKSKSCINEVPLERLIGTGVLLNAANDKIILKKPEYESKIIPNSIVLVFTGYSQKFGQKEYYGDHPVVSKELASLFVDKRIKMLCLDFPSPDHHPFEIHKLLLENNILIAENLTNLDKLLSYEKFEVFALPLNIQADSSPARIIARVL